MYTINDLYDLTHTLAGDYLARFTYPWEALSDLADYIRALGAQLDKLRQRRQPVAQLAFHKIQIFQQLPQQPLLAHCLPGYGEAKSAAAADDQNCTDPFVLHGSILSKRYVLCSLSSTTV